MTLLAWLLPLALAGSPQIPAPRPQAPTSDGEREAEAICVASHSLEACDPLFRRWMEAGRRSDVARLAKLGCEGNSVELCFLYLSYADERFWDHWKDKVAAQPFAIEPAPRELLSLLVAGSKVRGLSAKPEPATPDPALKKDLLEAWKAIPSVVRERFGARVPRVFLVRGASESATTLALLTSTGAFMKAFIVLNADGADRKANERASAAEASPFRLKGSQRLEAVVAEGADDTRVTALRLLLLRELGHVAALASSTLGPPELEGDAAALAGNPWVALSWQEVGGHLLARGERDFPQRSALKFFAASDQRVDGAKAASIYAALAKSGFPTLRAALGHHDDFAESFASYVHVVMMKKPYRVRLIEDGKVTAELGPCWAEARCAQKKAFIEKIFGR